MEKKKIAAATAAVFTYIKTMEEAACYSSQSFENDNAASLAMPDREISGKGPRNFNAWTNAGRLTQMQQNSMVLMKIR
jgi:hypothetical protein